MPPCPNPTNRTFSLLSQSLIQDNLINCTLNHKANKNAFPHTKNKHRPFKSSSPPPKKKKKDKEGSYAQKFLSCPLNLKILNFYKIIESIKKFSSPETVNSKIHLSVWILVPEEQNTTK